MAIAIDSTGAPTGELVFLPQQQQPKRDSGGSSKDLLLASPTASNNASSSSNSNSESLELADVSVHTCGQA